MIVYIIVKILDLMMLVILLKKVFIGLLCEQMGYCGIIIIDVLDMEGVQFVVMIEDEKGMYIRFKVVVDVEGNDFMVVDEGYVSVEFNVFMKLIWGCVVVQVFEVGFDILLNFYDVDVVVIVMWRVIVDGWVSEWCFDELVLCIFFWKWCCCIMGRLVDFVVVDCEV